MINIVKRYAIELVHEFCSSRRAQHFSNRCMQGPMFSLKQPLIRAPRRFGQLAGLRPRKEIAPFEHERAALPAFDSSPHRILPVRRVQYHFPDVVPAGAGTPCGLFCGHSLDGLL